MSLEVQQAKLAAYAELYDLSFVEIIIDAGESGKSLARPGLQRALSMLKSGKAEALVVVKLDRLTRSVRDLGDLLEKYFSSGRFALLSVAEQIDARSAGGRLCLNILASVSEWERNVLSERTGQAMQHLAAEGKFTGGVAPYGFAITSDGVHVEENAQEQAVIIAARELRAAGFKLRGISTALAEKGMLSRSGRKFDSAQIRRMLGGRAVDQRKAA